MVFEARLLPSCGLLCHGSLFIFLLVCNNGTRNMLVVDYLCCMWHKYYFLCNYLITLFNQFRGISVRSSDVLFNSKTVK
jgi:hypothetical protein